jgi:phage FluMu protein Com
MIVRCSGCGRFLAEVHGVAGTCRVYCRDCKRATTVDIAVATPVAGQ